ncbi:hypothetical protein [Promicromonospora sp. NPDC059942]|uniref:hypothetical protein n=1 Tax=Promicromonospora sp. NPDC059942 TaxID=3347009 RepID=UPI003653D549
MTDERTTARPGAEVVQAGPRTARNRGAAWTLVVLTPLIAELALGSTPVRMAWLVLLWMPVYGAGVLLIRELVARRGRGWPSILLLALAYELVEDGIGLQALTSPHLYDAASWGARVLGVNLPYFEANAIYHAVFTVCIPITLTNLLFPAHRGRPYLGVPGTVVAAVVAVLGVGLLRTVSLSEDAGYQAPAPFVLGVAVLVVVLGIVALYVVPPARGRTAPGDGAAPGDAAAPGDPAAAPGRADVRAEAGSASVPSRGMLFGASGLATLVFFGLSFPVFGARQPAFTQGWLVLVPMALTAVGAVACYRYLTRTAARPGWTPRHTLALVGGALVAHSLGGLVIMAHTTVDRVGLVVIIGLTVGGLLLVDRRLRR